MVVPALILTHGHLGQMLMEAVERILGPQSSVIVLSNDDCTLDEMKFNVESRLGAGPGLLFVDFCGGSPYVACKSLRETHPNYAVISGVNLPMLFSFFTKRQKLPFGDLVETVKADGLRGIQLLADDPHSVKP
jgi:mannose/fructose-specific phosphotransferase system component IIA